MTMTDIADDEPRPRNRPEETAFLSAVASGRLEECRAHLDAGMSPDTVLGGHHLPHSALHLAVDWGQPEVCALLLARGANVNAVAEKTDTPLHRACEGWRLDLITLLAANGADIAAVDARGFTPLHLFVRHFCDEDYPALAGILPNAQVAVAAKLLSEFAAGFDEGDMRGRKGAMRAVLNARLAMVAIDDVMDSAPRAGLI